jgi:hypothetical protein
MLRAKLNKATFRAAIMHKAILKEVTARETIFAEADMTEAQFAPSVGHHTDMTSAVFDITLLTGARGLEMVNWNELVPRTMTAQPEPFELKTLLTRAGLLGFVSAVIQGGGEDHDAGDDTEGEGDEDATVEDEDEDAEDDGEGDDTDDDGQEEGGKDSPKTSSSVHLSSLSSKSDSSGRTKRKSHNHEEEVIDRQNRQVLKPYVEAWIRATDGGTTPVSLHNAPKLAHATEQFVDALDEGQEAALGILEGEHHHHPFQY